VLLRQVLLRQVLLRQVQLRQVLLRHVPLVLLLLQVLVVGEEREAAAAATAAPAETDAAKEEAPAAAKGENAEAGPAAAVPEGKQEEVYFNFDGAAAREAALLKELTEAKARQVDAIVRELPETRYTVTTINTGTAQGKIYASTYIRLTDRKNRQRSVDQLAALLRERLKQVPGITVTHAGAGESVGGNKWTVLQTSCTIKNDLIDQSTFSPLSFDEGLPDAPSDGIFYGRKNGGWTALTEIDGGSY
jgi:hypothetical protein